MTAYLEKEYVHEFGFNLGPDVFLFSIFSDIGLHGIWHGFA